MRHGLSEDNEAGVWGGSVNSALTEKGKQQAKEAGKEAKTLKIDVIVSSPMRRTLDTAKIIAKEIGYPVKSIHVNKLLIERNFGELEGKPHNPDLDLDGFSDIETTDSVIERSRLALRWLENEFPGDTTVLVVAHGQIGRAFRNIIANHEYGGDGLPNGKIISWEE